MGIAWDMTVEDLEAIELGANVLGTGGGGKLATDQALQVVGSQAFGYPVSYQP